MANMIVPQAALIRRANAAGQTGCAIGGSGAAAGTRKPHLNI